MNIKRTFWTSSIATTFVFNYAIFIGLPAYPGPSISLRSAPLIDGFKFLLNDVLGLRDLLPHISQAIPYGFLNYAEGQVSVNPLIRGQGVDFLFLTTSQPFPNIAGVAMRDIEN